MRLLITGATGFVGSWLVRAAIAGGHYAVCGVRGGSDDRRLRRLETSCPDRLERVVLDVRHASTIERAFEDSRIDAVVHAAAYGVDYRQQDPVLAAEINILGTLRVWESAARAGVGRLVHLGTAYEFGSHTGRISEDTARRPSGIYGKTKLAASELLRECFGREGPNPVVLWLFGVFGPGEGDHKLVPQVVQAARSHEPLALTRGMQQRDYTYVGDAARAILAVATLPEGSYPAGERLNLCSGEATTVRDLALQIARHLGGEHVLHFGERRDREDDNSRMVGDPSRWQAFMRRAGLGERLRRTALADVLDRWDEEETECAIW